MKQSLHHSLQQKMSPRQIKLMKMVQMSTTEFEEKIEEEIEENPALEKDIIEQPKEEESNDGKDDDFDIKDYMNEDDIPEYKMQAGIYDSSSDDKNEIPFSGGKSFTQHLIEQLHLIKMSEENLVICEYLLGCIDSKGYIYREAQDIANDMAFSVGIYTTKEKIEENIERYIHQLEPVGVGARSLQDCLLIQLKSKKPDSKYAELATKVIEFHFEDFSKKHHDKLVKKTGASKEELKKAFAIIRKLNPKPGSGYFGNQKNIEQIVPDFEITIEGEELHLSLNGRNVPHLSISSSYKNILSEYSSNKEKGNKISSTKKTELNYVKQKLDSAKWFIDAINQRRDTLIRTMTSIMGMQKEYLLSGDKKDIRPMILKDIAEKTDLDISTISRVSNSKYVSTPYGVFLIRTLFSEGMKNTDGEDISTREIKTVLREIIDAENKQKPLADQKIVLLMKEKGYKVARRTIAKYREQLNIPVARMRKKI